MLGLAALLVGLAALAPAAAPASGCGAASAYSGVVSGTPGLVGYWRLGEATGTVACDDAGASNGAYRYGYGLAKPGLIVGDPNTAVSLDGVKAYVNIPSVAALNPTANVSIEAWISPVALSNNQTIVRKNNQFLVRLVSSSLFFRMWWSDGAYTELTSPSVVQPGGSQQVVAVYDGAAMSLYWNGSAVASKAVVKRPAITSNPLLLGNSDGYDYFAGRLDEVAEYSAAMTTAKIVEHYAVGRGSDSAPPAPPSGLVAAPGDRSVALDWNDNVEGDLGSYRLFRRNPDGTWPPSPVQSTATSTATDTGLVNGVTYEYRVTAVDLGGNESAPSGSVTSTPIPAPPVPPTGLTALGAASAIGLRWTASTGPDHYQVYRRNADGSWPGAALASAPGTASSFVDTGAPATATYRITAVDSIGRESQPSSAAGASLTPGVLLAAGDIAGCDTSGDEATAAILDTQSGTVVTIGDNVYEDGSPQQFAGCYDPTWGRQRWRTRPGVGDHEYRTPGASGYFAYFGAAAGDPATGYYSFDQAGWHIVVLNINCSAIGGCDVGNAEERWLRQDLAAHPALCTAAIVPGPRFSSGTVHGSEDWMQPFWQALYDYGADVVLSGDDHIYERFAPQSPVGAADPSSGIRQFTVGTGGRGHYPIGTVVANSEVRNNDTFGVLRLSLRADGYDWSFLPEAGRTFTDGGSSTCH